MLLGNNQLISIVLSGFESTDGDVLPDVSYSFSTTFSPLYSSPNKIRAVAGSYVQGISDEMLLYLIHLYSVEANNLSICKIENFPKWNYYAGQWVTYNAALEAVMNSEIHLGSSGQKVYKKLGDFSISKDGKGTGTTPTKGMLDKLECEILKLSVAVKFCKEPLTSCDKGVVDNDLRNGLAAQLVVKGECLPRPGFGRMFTRDGNYPALTGFIRILDKYRLTNHKPTPNQFHYEQY